VAIKLVDENDKPIPRAKYIIILPDGTRKEDYLDDNGYAYFDELTPGVCDVAFPELGPFNSFHNSLTTSKRIEDLRTGVSGTVGMTATPPTKALESIDVVLLDESGKGVPDVEFEIALPNGDTARGILDKNGRDHVEGIEPGGDCNIRFPRLDEAFVKFDKTDT
jgi:hypothetical protein